MVTATLCVYVCWSAWLKTWCFISLTLYTIRDQLFPQWWWIWLARTLVLYQRTFIFHILGFELQDLGGLIIPPRSVERWLLSIMLKLFWQRLIKMPFSGPASYLGIRARNITMSSWCQYNFLFKQDTWTENACSSLNISPITVSEC